MKVALHPARIRRLIAVLFGSVLLSALMATGASAAAADTPITAEQLEQLPPYPAEYASQSYPERTAWLQAQLATAGSHIRRYQLQRELAF